MSKSVNILWLTTDHQVFCHHRSLHGSPLALRTYERLVAQGTECVRAYAVSPICGPARGTMMTGHYPHNHGLILNDGQDGTPKEFREGEHLYGDLLREAGYRTAYFGKWHCGTRKIPKDYGFEGWSMPGYGNPYASPAYAGYLERRGLPRAKVRVEWCVRDNLDQVGQTYELGLKHEDGTGPFGPFSCCARMLTPKETHEAYFVTSLASEWLREYASNYAAGRDTRPFCLRVDVWGPHHPYHVAEPFYNSIPPGSFPAYPSMRQNLSGLPANYEDCRIRWQDRASMTAAHAGETANGEEIGEWDLPLRSCYEHAMMVDDAIGRLVDNLEALGLAENTAILYTADHGDLMAAHGGLFNKDSLMVEETMRIPLVIWFPEQKASSVMKGLTGNLDLVPTVLDLAGAPVPSDMDGRSIPGMIRGTTPCRDAMMCEHHGGFRREFFQRMLLRRDMKYIAHLDDIDELYDLRNDPYELDNMSGKLSVRPLLKELRVCLADMMAGSRDNSPEARELANKMMMKEGA